MNQNQHRLRLWLRSVSRCCARAHRTGWRALARAAAFVRRVADCRFFRDRLNLKQHDLEKNEPIHIGCYK